MPFIIISATINPVLYFIFPTVSFYLGQASSFLFYLLENGLIFLSKLPYSYFYFPSIPLYYFIFILVFFTLLPIIIKIKHSKLFLSSSVILLLLIYNGMLLKKYIYQPVEVSFLDVSQGDAIFISLLGNYHILIDAGKGKSWNKSSKGEGEKIILPFLNSRGIHKLDLAIISHPDYDHYGGMTYLAQNISIDKMMYPVTESKNKTWQDLINVTKEKEIITVAPQCGDTLYRYQSIVMTVEAPCYNHYFSSKNDNSLVIKLQSHTKCFLFAGDVEKASENWLTQNRDLKCDILKIPHHGSASSSTEAFLEKVKPEIGILSYGKFNRYSHPDSTVIKRYNKKKIKLYATPKQGSLSFFLNRFSKTFKITTSL